MDRRVYDNYIFKIVEQGNLSKAATRLGISQPALSSGLTSLENELGFKIFNRKRVPITFTPEGELYYEYLQKMQVLSEDFRLRLDNYTLKKSSKVVIGGPSAYLDTMVTDTVLSMRCEKPHYRIALKSATLSELIDMSLSGEINCFVSTSDDLPENFEKHLIKQENVYLCIPKENPINKQLTDYRVTLGETGKYFDYSLLDSQQFVFMEEGQPLREEMEKFFFEYSITPENNIVVNQVSTAVKIAIKGEGICIASENSLQGAGMLDELCIYSLPNTISGRNIYLAYNKELFMPDAGKLFIERLINKERKI